MRILHTSDWHLGHTLHGVARDEEHARFLGWLLGVLAKETPDGLIIAGDVFDTATPPARAERAFYDFLAEAKQRVPHLDVVVVAGNHDSAVRLESATEVLKALDVRVVGNLHRRAGAPLDTERLVVPLRTADGEVGAWVAAIPFLRPADLPPVTGDDDDLARRVRAVYDEVLAAARERQRPGQALVATGHATLTGAELSADSERTITGGLDGLPVTIFPDDVAYVALGHLHKAQAVGGLEHVRYCGSPIPLSLAEANYRHEVRLVTLDGERFEKAVAHLVPRSVGMLRLPTGGPLPLELTLALLSELPALDDDADDGRSLPFLEVRVALDDHEADLRRRVEEALEGKAVRLVKLSVTSREVGPALAEQRPSSSLGDLDPREVFERAYRRKHEDDPSPEMIAAFGELLAQTRAAESPSEVAVPIAATAAGAKPSVSVGAA